MNSEVLGFVGLGSMGSPMAARFVTAGHQLVGFDATGTQERLPPGAMAATSIEEVATQVDTVLMSLPDGEASKKVCSQLAHADERRTQVVIDLSTIGMVAARDCARMLEPTEMIYVDAPVSGGVPGARVGSLAVMVGADEHTFRKIEPLLTEIAKNCFRMGDDPGQGQAMKLLNNFLSCTAMAATSEAVLFGSRVGLDLERMINVLNSSSGRNSASMDKFPQSVIPGSYDYGFAAGLAGKDMELYIDNVRSASSAHEIGTAIVKTWRDFSGSFPDKDFTYIYKYLNENGGS